MHCTYSLFLGTQIKKQIIPYIINHEKEKKKKKPLVYQLFKQAKHMESGQRHQSIFLSKIPGYNQVHLGQQQKRNSLAQFPNITGSIFSYHLKMLEIKLKLSFVRLICNFAS